MMYQDKFVAVLKTGGKILRENKDIVTIPFGSEYSILLKNLNSRKAVVSVSIDGTDVIKGRLIVDANSDVELERFIEKMDSGNRFKFIQKTAKIQEFRGDKVEDGLIRIEFQFEKERPISYIRNSEVTPKNLRGLAGGCSASRGIGDSWEPMSVNHNSGSYVTSTSLSLNTPLADEGITVKGSESNQRFTYGTVGDLESEKHVIVLKLLGTDGEPIFVDTKKQCTTCGTKNESTSKYCSECGTFLE